LRDGQKEVKELLRDISISRALRTGAVAGEAVLVGSHGLVTLPGDLPGLDVDPLAEADARALVRELVDVFQGRRM
jgi:hypothetical protein